MGSFKHALSVFRKCLAINQPEQSSNAIDIRYAIAALQGTAWTMPSSSSVLCARVRRAPAEFVSRVFDLQARRVGYDRWANKLQLQRQREEEGNDVGFASAHQTAHDNTDNATHQEASPVSLASQPPKPTAAFPYTQSFDSTRFLADGTAKASTLSLFNEVHGLVFEEVASAMRVMVESVLGLNPAPPPEALLARVNEKVSTSKNFTGAGEGANDGNEDSRADERWDSGDAFGWGQRWLDVLDLGCGGKGRAGVQFRGHANRLTGIDLSPLAIQEVAVIAFVFSPFKTHTQRSQILRSLFHSSIFLHVFCVFPFESHLRQGRFLQDCTMRQFTRTSYRNLPAPSRNHSTTRRRRRRRRRLEAEEVPTLFPPSYFGRHRWTLSLPLTR